MSGAASRNRGARAERAVVAYLRANGWPDARRYLAGDGRQPGDIDAIPGVVIEVKDQARACWPLWIRQAKAEANGRLWTVVRRTRGVPDVGMWAAVVDETRVFPSRTVARYSGSDYVEALSDRSLVYDPKRRVVAIRFGCLVERLKDAGYGWPEDAA